MSEEFEELKTDYLMVPKALFEDEDLTPFARHLFIELLFLATEKNAGNQKQKTPLEPGRIIIKYIEIERYLKVTRGIFAGGIKALFNKHWINIESTGSKQRGVIVSISNPCTYKALPEVNNQEITRGSLSKSTSIYNNSTVHDNSSTITEPKILFNLYNVVMSDNKLEPAIKLTQIRRKLINTRLKENASFEYWESVFQSVADSDFYSGRSGEWLACDFNWILKNSEHHEKLYRLRKAHAKERSGQLKGKPVTRAQELEKSGSIGGNVEAVEEWVERNTEEI